MFDHFLPEAHRPCGDKATTPLDDIRLWLEALPGEAVKAMYQRFVPDACWPSGSPAMALERLRFRLSREAVAMMPPQAVVELPSLGRAEAVGKLCHWLALRLLRMPWLHWLDTKSTEELRQVLQAVGVRRPAKSSRRNLMAKILRAASADGAVLPCDHDVDVDILRRLLDREVPQSQRTVAVESVGYMNECPKIVQEAIVGRK
mmetsp:Transcript_101017/g.283182  ORF Transcript_101017/g.283182 Transcript_101017/m.283182 type:complete len:203 (+) Transcript_101017:2-610(+)